MFRSARPLSPGGLSWFATLAAGLPLVSFKDLDSHKDLLAGLAGKVVFIGVYSDTAARDRIVTPYGDREYGVRSECRGIQHPSEWPVSHAGIRCIRRWGSIC